MVVSSLNTSFVYPDNRGVYADDEDHETNLYEIVVHGVPFTFGLGNPKRHGNLVFFPMYLVVDSELHSQIGIFECLYENISTLYDEDGELNISKFGRPLLYSHTTRRYLQCVLNSNKLCEQNAVMAKEEREIYKRMPNDPWVCHFLSSPYYDLLKYRDTWFDVLADAFEGVLSAKQLQVLYAESVPEECYTEDMLRHKRATKAYETLTIELKQFLAEHKRCKERIQNTFDRNSHMEVVRLAERISAQHKRTVAERRYYKELIFKPLDTVSNFADYRAMLRAQLSPHIKLKILEDALRTQIIVFSKDHYDRKEYAQIVRFSDCAEPKRFLMVSQEINRGKMSLITYKGYHIIPFTSLPHTVKMRMANRCMEGAPTNVMLLRQFMRERHLNPISISIPKWCDPQARLLFSIDLSDKIPPGDEFGEINSKNTPLAELSLIPDWRKKMSKEWICPFELAGNRWASIEHFIHGSKFTGEKRVNFSLDSGSEVAKDVKRARAAALDVKGGGRSDLAEEQAVDATLAQNPELVELLRHTGDALLLYYNEGAVPTPAISWMKLRYKLKLNSK